MSNQIKLTWKQLLEQLRLIISRTGAESAVKYKYQIMSMLQQYTAEPEDYNSYLNFDKEQYTKNLVEDLGADCNVIVMCWVEGQTSQFHGHEQSKCFVKVLEGMLMEQQVSYPSGAPEGQVLALKERLLAKDDVAYIDDTIGIHKVSNISEQEKAVTLHIYMPAYRKCRIFPEEEEGVSLSYNASFLSDVECCNKK